MGDVPRLAFTDRATPNAIIKSPAIRAILLLKRPSFFIKLIFFTLRAVLQFCCLLLALAAKLINIFQSGRHNGFINPFLVEARSAL